MQPTQTTSVIRLVARRLQDDLSWGEGAIQPQAAYASDDQQQALVDTVLASMQPVLDDEAAFSSCTDGRLPVRLQSGQPIPVREQMVGADMVSAFYVAETLGERFYKDAHAPVAERVREVAEFLKENGLMPSSHIGCGAAAGFAAIAANVVRFVKDPRFVARLQELLPEGVYDQALHQTMLQASQARLDAKLYDGLTAQTFLDVVQAVSGARAIAELQDDGRGVHGHVEELIVRVRIPGVAINEAKVGAATNGREVFGVNDTRLERLAHLFGRGNDQDYRMAYMALEDFASAGHGTLAKNLPTFIVTAV